MGRVLAEPVYNQEVELFPNALLDEDGVDLLDRHNIDRVVVRSSITCESEYGICALCYGRDLAVVIWLMLVRLSVWLRLSQLVSLVPS